MRILFAFLMLFVFGVELHAQTVTATSNSYTVDIFWSDGSKKTRRAPSMKLRWLIRFHADVPNGVYQVHYTTNGNGVVGEINYSGSTTTNYVYEEVGVGVGFSGGSLTREFWINRKGSADVLGRGSFTFVANILDLVYPSSTPDLILTTLPYIIGGPVEQATVIFAYDVTNKGLLPIDLRLMVKGAVVGSLRVPGRTEVTPVYRSGSYQLEVPPGSGGIYQWEFKRPDGGWGILDTNSFLAPFDGQSGTNPNPFSLLLHGSDPKPDPSPSPTPTPPPPVAPEPAPAVPGDPSKPPTVRPVSGGGSPSTNDDVYEDVRAALNQAGNGDTARPGISSGFSTGEQHAGMKKDVLDISDENITSSLSTVGTGISTFKGNFGPDKQLNLPSVSGRKLDYNFTVPMLGDVHLDLNPYSAHVEVLRNLWLLVLYISFWFATVRVVRSSIA